MRHCLFGSVPRLHSFESLMFHFSELQHIFLGLICSKFSILSNVVENNKPQFPARVLNLYLSQFDFHTYVSFSFHYLFFFPQFLSNHPERCRWILVVFGVDCVEQSLSIILGCFCRSSARLTRQKPLI